MCKISFVHVNRATDLSLCMIRTVTGICHYFDSAHMSFVQSFYETLAALPVQLSYSLLAAICLMLVSC